MNDVVISAQGVCKNYFAFDSHKARLQHILSAERSRAGVHEIRALRDISFEIRRGERVAVIGRNGGGKSTLSQIITGTLTPTSGHVQVNGRISALLELGSGFNPEYSGRDNVLMNGLLLGLSKQEVLARFAEVEAFADIGDVLDRPVKTYSSGMMMRLAFAVQVLGKPDILIVDEALSVGDFFFQQKCLGHIRKLCEQGLTLLFVSHDMGTVRDICSRSLYLRQGELKFDGDTRVAIQHYFSEQPQGAVAEAPVFDEQVPNDIALAETVLRDAVWRAPAKSAETAQQPNLLAIALYDESGMPGTSFAMASQMTIKVLYRPPPDQPAHITLTLFNKYNQILSVIGSYSLGTNPPLTRIGDMVVCTLSVRLTIEAGNYSFNIALGIKSVANRGTRLDAAEAIGPISVLWDYENERAPFLGMVGLPANAEFHLASAGSQEDTALVGGEQRPAAGASVQASS